MTMTFDHDEDGIRLMATYVAQLVKEGVKFKITQEKTYSIVELTGGF